ncbi:MFS transporter [Paenibacillus chitinolyticus]|uniref:MDR family MFS transporter n=1 Tax=Paenibacillus chitinolyticus TaxID=79263 RepID=UPI0026E4A2E0|nr:MDR family MFS transporter [Paenibacillus chitinolyticus]GKS15036.1 MFS transporter [Paenibacillus chitinolyticus]
MIKDKTNVTLVMAGLLLGMLISTLDQTIMATAMPTVARELGGLSLYSWVFSIYMLTSTTSMPIFGKLADLYGRKRLYIIGMGLFMLGSVLCSFSTGMLELVIFRGLQGLGAGALMPLSITIIGDLVPLEKRGRIQGIFAGLTTLANVIGPALGGLFVQYLSWQWVFYINLPIGLAAIGIILTSMKESKMAGKRSIDWFGALTLSGSVVTILLALVLGGGDQPQSWGSAQVTGLFTAGAALLGVFLWVESKAKEPIIPLQLFRNRLLSATFIVAFFMSAGMFGAVSYIPLYVQGVVGVSPAAAGYILTPMMVALGAAVVITGRLLHRTTYRAFNLLGMTLMGLGFGLLATMSTDTGMPLVIVYMVLTGLGIGFIIPTLNTAAIGAVGKERRGVATSLVQFSRSIGGTIGVSVLGVLMTGRMAAGMPGLGERFAALGADKLRAYADPQALLDGSMRVSLPADLLRDLQNVFTQGIHTVFIAGIVIAVVGLAASLFMGTDRMMSKPVSPGTSAGGASSVDSTTAGSGN